MNRVKCKINEVKFYSRSIHEILNKLILHHIQTKGGGGGGGLKVQSPRHYKTSNDSCYF